MKSKQNMRTTTTLWTRSFVNVSAISGAISVPFVNYTDDGKKKKKETQLRSKVFSSFFLLSSFVRGNCQDTPDCKALRHPYVFFFYIIAPHDFLLVLAFVCCCLVFNHTWVRRSGVANTDSEVSSRL